MLVLQQLKRRLRALRRGMSGRSQKNTVSEHLMIILLLLLLITHDATVNAVSQDWEEKIMEGIIGF